MRAPAGLAVYVVVSFRLFELTNLLKNAAVPHSNNPLLLRNTAMMVAGGGALWGIVAAVLGLAGLMMGRY